MSKPSKVKALEGLQKALDEIPQSRRDSAEFREWEKTTEYAIEYAFGKNSNEVSEFKNFFGFLNDPEYIALSGKIRNRITTHPDIIVKFSDGFNAAEGHLTAMIKQVESWEDEEEVQIEEVKKQKEVTTPGKNVFIIHGHDEVSLLQLRIILKEDFKLNPIILKEQPDIGSLTIIEKFEEYAEKCSFAIAIFTPDDQIDKEGQIYLQARPNVIYELGWFCGRYERKHVMLLLKEGTEIFSDFSGVIQYRFKNEVKEIYKDIEKSLKSIGLI